MTNPCILLKDGSECPEGILDAFITSAACKHDFGKKKNSKKTEHIHCKTKNAWTRGM